MNLKALHNLSYGLYVISSSKGDRFNGQIANTVFQVTSQPPAIAVCINKQNLTHEFITESRAFTASMLSKDTPLSFIGHFGFKSGRDTDKFKDINYRLGETKVPIVLDHSLAYLEARVVNQVDVGTHTMFIGELAGAEVLKEGEPMTYAYYQRVKRGTTPKTAPSYISGSHGWGSKAVEQLTAMISNLKAEVLAPVMSKGFPREEDFQALDDLAGSIAKKHKKRGFA